VFISAAYGAGPQIDESKGCIGIQIESQQGIVFVKSDLPNSPAEDAGMKAGDVIEAVQTSSTSAVISVAGKTLNEVVDLIRGPVGDPVVIDVLREDMNSN
jgi:carboxyl-terminal processing protease